MNVFLNGAFVPEEQAVVSIFDRSFRYGDGLFEAVLVVNGKMFRWPEHAARLERGAAMLNIRLPHSREEMFGAGNELIARNALTDAVLRIQVSRGIGPRGYAPSGEEKPIVVMTMHPAPARNTLEVTGWKLTICSLRVATNDSLAGLKSCSRLLQVMAASEAHLRLADEALLLNTNGQITEGSTSNLFWISRGIVCTTPLSAGALPGVTRGVILKICQALCIPCREKKVRPFGLRRAEGVFLSLTSRGIVEATSIDEQPLSRSPLTQRLRGLFEEQIGRECR